jgi:hypothetical protein
VRWHNSLRSQPISADDLFPPVEPVDSLIGPWKVVPRRRRFGQKSRELYKELNQTQKELKESKGKNSSPGFAPPEPGSPENPPAIDKLV